MSIDTLWYTRCPVPSAQTVAINLGWLDEEFAPDGIAVRSLATSGDRNVHLSHYTHSQPNSFRFGGLVPPFIARASGSDVRVIGLGWVDRTGGIYTLAGGRETLRGARLSLPRRLKDSTDWWRASVIEGYARTLKSQGLTLDDVVLVDVEIDRAYVDDAAHGGDTRRSLWGARSQFAVQREEVLALARGEVDAIYTDGAMGALVRAFLGLRPLVELTSAEEGPPDAFGGPVALTASGRLIDERPDLVERWLGRLLDAQAWAAANPDIFRPIIARDSGVPEDFVEDSYTDAVTRQMDVSLADNRVARLRRRHDELASRGFITPIDFDRFIDAAPLTRALAAREERAALAPAVA